MSVLGGVGAWETDISFLKLLFIVLHSRSCVDGHSARKCRPLRTDMFDKGGVQVKRRRGGERKKRKQKGVGKCE